MVGFSFKIGDPKIKIKEIGDFQRLFFDESVNRMS
jgi:hypothetical protein